MAFDVALTKNFTTQQKTFVRLLAEGMHQRDAGLAAGYHPGDIDSTVAHMLQQPAIMAAVQIGVARAMAIAAPISLKLLRRIVETEGADMRLRVVCAKTILDRAGHIAPKAVALGQAGELPLNEMSTTELRALADKLEGEISGRAKDVSSAKPAPRKPQAIEDII